MGADRPRGAVAARLQLSDPDEAEKPPRRQVWGRRVGPRLRPGRREALAEGLPRLEIALPDRARSLDVGSLFPFPARSVWLEIGFGGGEHLAALAAANPDVGFIGVEPFLDGVAWLLVAAAGAGMNNVRVLSDDARLMLRALPDASIERLFVLFPDPWPKLRHNKRRIVNTVTAGEFARVVAPGGDMLLATDDPDYVDWMLRAVLPRPEFAWRARRPGDWREPPAGWPGTRYEAKARAAGRRPYFLGFRRV